MGFRALYLSCLIVQAVRDRLASRADYDAGAIFRRILEVQDKSGRECVSYPARRVVEGWNESSAV